MAIPISGDLRNYGNLFEYKVGEAKEDLGSVVESGMPTPGK